MIDLGAELLSAAEAGVVGLATAGADRTVQRKIGRLVEWLPDPGADCCECALLLGMEAEFSALAAGKQDVMALPGIRGVPAGSDHPVSVVVLWNEPLRHYVLITMPDFAAQQVEILLGSERRARRLIEQQLEAATSEARFASLARTRLRLARDLHDTLVHSIMALLTQIRLTRHFLTADPSRVADGLATAEAAALDGLVRARDAIARLRMPDEAETDPAIEEMLAGFADKTGAKVSVDIDEQAREALSRHGVTIQRVLVEALRNIEVHANARLVIFRAAEEETTAGRTLVVEIRDDGAGFDPSVPKVGHFGLVGMGEFAELAGGVCVVESARGKGTLVRLSLPASGTSSGGLGG